MMFSLLIIGVIEVSVYCTNILTPLIHDHKNIYAICQFLDEFIGVSKSNSSGSHSFFLRSPTIQFFLRCFTGYLKPANSSHQSMMSSLLELNYGLIFDELESCTNRAIMSSDEHVTSISLITKLKHAAFNLSSDDAESDELMEDYYLKRAAMNELSHLSENANHLHRPSVDGDFITQFPHVLMAGNTDIMDGIDVMTGITDDESFYFLENEYNFNEILRHSFIYSSLLKLTDNLIEKLTLIEQNIELNVCLKRRLLEFYQVTSFSRADLVENRLVKDYKSLEIMCDYEFVLPLITQLKFKLNNSGDRSKLYVYNFAFKPSFNIMLQSYLPFSSIYKEAHARLNKSVVPHFSELDYVFGLPVSSRLNLNRFKSELNAFNYTQEEYELSLTVMNYWTNFAKYG